MELHLSLTVCEVFGEVFDVLLHLLYLIPNHIDVPSNSERRESSWVHKVSQD